MAALTLIWAMLEQDRLNRRGARMGDDILKAVVELGKEASPRAGARTARAAGIVRGHT